MRALAIALFGAAAVLAACTGDPAITAAPSPTPAPTPTEAPPTTTPSPTRTLGPGETPGPTVIDLLPLLSSEITVANLADQPLTLRVTLVDTESSDEFEVGAFELQPLQVTTQAILPTRFRLDFEFGGSSASGGTCSIDIADGEELQFAVLDTGIAMTSNLETEPEDPAELLVATASRCRAGGAS